MHCCEICVHYDFDEEMEEYFCGVAFDQDELSRYYTHSNYTCPYFKVYNEYDTVKKQIQFYEKGDKELLDKP